MRHDILKNTADPPMTTTSIMKVEESMPGKSHHYVCISKNDNELLEDHHLEEILDTEERGGAPLRTCNARKSLEHHLERQRLKKRIADFDWWDTESSEGH
jgi:hypothetical protein